MDTLVSDLVVHTELSFYYYVLFGDCSRFLKLSGLNNDTITKIGNEGWHTSAYSKHWIPSNDDSILRWKIIVFEDLGDSISIIPFSPTDFASRDC